jgi:formylglycine-generating enzyme required for sulfatase activity
VAEPTLTEKDFEGVADKALGDDRPGAIEKAAAVLVTAATGHPLAGVIAGKGARALATAVVDHATDRFLEAGRQLDDARARAAAFRRCLLDAIGPHFEALQDRDDERFLQLVRYLGRNVASADGQAQLIEEMRELRRAVLEGLVAHQRLSVQRTLPQGGRNERRHLRLVVISPGDVAAERDSVGRVVAELNRTLCFERDLCIDAYRWEQDAYTAFHPQGYQTGVLDRILGIDDADVAIAIFWARLGTPDPTFGGKTGSQHELDRALERLAARPERCLLPHVAAYQNEADAKVRRHEQDRLAQQASLYRYLNDVEQRCPGVIGTYEGASAFAEKLRVDLTRWLMDCFPMSSRSEPEGEHTEPTTSTDPAGLDVYREAIERQHAHIELAGFKTRLRVPILLDELYVPLQAMAHMQCAGSAEFADAEDACSRLREHGEAVDLPLVDGFRAAIERHRRGLVLLGDPGSGKTTHMKRLLLCAVRKGEGSEKLGLPPGLVPVFLPLRELRDVRAPLEDFIRAELGTVHPDLPETFGQALLQRGRLLLLFDGLDEIPSTQDRAQVARAIERLSRDRPLCVPVVTCRFAGYTDQARLDEHFLELHVRPLSREQADAFIRNWYRVVETGLATADTQQAQALAQTRADNLGSRLGEGDFRSARLVAMTRNPLLLANLCLVHRDRGDLPRGRARLYDECIDVLLERWRKDNKKLGVSVEAAVGRRVLQPAALWLHSQQERTRATAAELGPAMEPALAATRWTGGSAKEFLRAVRDESGLLTGWGHDQYGFMHLGFQEYLAALEIRRRAFEGDTGPLIALAAQYGQSWWQEVLLVVLSIGNPSLFVPLMREVVKQRAFGEDTAPMGLILEDAAEVSTVPFVELLEQEPGDDEGLWMRQLSALRVLKQLRAEGEIERLGPRLRGHPLDAINGEFRVDVRTVQAHIGLRPVTASAIIATTAETEPAHTDAATAVISAPRHIIHPKTGMELIHIPGGTFLMGAPVGEREADNDERPQHTVTLSPFYLGKFPVTNDQYARFLAENPGAPEPGHWANRAYNQANQPVVGVSWDQARAYAEWAGLRLPTEAEWEYACRGGSKGRYCSGNTEADLDRVGWSRANSGGRLHAVGEKEPNAWGIHDMHGNVWEWCADWYGPYQAEAQTNPVGPDEGQVRVVRGGGWDGGAGDCRSAQRSSDSPGLRDDVLGFRLLAGQPG